MAPDPPRTSVRDRTRLLATPLVLMVATSVAVGGIALWTHARAYEEHRVATLRGLAKSQARLIEAVAAFDAEHGAQDQHHELHDDAVGATLSQLVAASHQLRCFGETGEYVLGRREGEKIVFPLKRRFAVAGVPDTLPIDSSRASPMREALRGNRGWMIGVDYRGEEVFAAYEPIAGLGWGLVAKIDVREVRAPLVWSSLLVAGGALLIILAGISITLRVVRPVFRRMEQAESTLARRQELDSAVASLSTAFVGITSAGIDEAIVDALDLVCRVLGVDTCFLTLSSDDDTTGRVMHRCRCPEPRAPTSRLALPIHRGARRIGSLEIEWTGPHGPRPTEDVAFLKSVTEIVSSALERKLSANLEARLAQSQKMEAIGRLAGGVAHDFNNLLTVINGYSGLLVDRFASDGAVREDLQEIRKAGERGADLTRQLLAFGRKQLLQPKVLDANAVLVGMTRMLRRVIGEDIDLESILSTDLGEIEMDPGQLEQVIVNLAVNARDAMPDGGRLTIETANVGIDEQRSRELRHLTTGPHVCLSVRDNGSGMDAKTMQQIFEPFFTTKPAGMGSGLGLATVYGIVTQSGGEIAVSSRPGEGTRFDVYLPTVDKPIADLELETSSLAELRGSETILLAEDEQEVRDLVRRILEGRGYAVLPARDGNEALALVARHEGSIDLLLTDVVMPGLSGPELAERVRCLRPDAKILYVSGHAHDVVARHGLVGNPSEFLQKPCAPEALLHKVRSMLGVPGAIETRPFTPEKLMSVVGELLQEEGRNGERV